MCLVGEKINSELSHHNAADEICEQISAIQIAFDNYFDRLTLKKPEPSGGPNTEKDDELSEKWENLNKIMEKTISEKEILSEWERECCEEEEEQNSHFANII